MKTVTLITKDDCSLCVKVRETLETMRTTIPFTLEIRNLESDERYLEMYADKIPVVLIDGREEFIYSVNPNKLEKLLR
jgi:glutaredoxin